MDLTQLAERTLQCAIDQGADEVDCQVHEGRRVELARREGKLERATEATSRRLSLAVLKDDRYSSHSTSDLRPLALDAFVTRAVESTHYLEPEPARRQADESLCGRGVSEESLDQNDPAWAQRGADEREAASAELEAALAALRSPAVISSAVRCSDGQGRTIRIMTNGFRGESRGAWFSAGGTLTLREGDKRPESSAYYGARYLSDLPRPEAIAAEVLRRSEERIGAAPIASGSYSMWLPGRLAGKILSVLRAPLSGASLHQGRSCLAGKLGTSIGSEHFTLVDDPSIPRGLGSRPWDGDALRSRTRTIVRAGVLEQYNIGVYHSRKLDRPATGGGASNWVIPPGSRAPIDIARDHPRLIEVTGFLGGNSNGVSGDFSFGIRGVYWEAGERGPSLAEMNVSGNALKLFHSLVEVGNDPWIYSSVRSPSLVFEGVQFSGT